MKGLEDSSQILVTPDLIEGDISKGLSLRPKKFCEFIGQETVLENVKIMVESAKIRGEALGHILLSGPPGLGKTSLSMILANEIGAGIQVVSGPAIEKKGDLAAILTNLDDKEVLFIDEIHRLPVAIEEILYAAMEDYRLDILVGQGPMAKTLKIDLSPFTLIGATTKAGQLSKPLRDRFIGQFNFNFYDKESLKKMVSLNANKMNLDIEVSAAEKIANCSRGTPRIANRILNRVRDFSVVLNQKVVTKELLNKALKLMQLSDSGLGPMDVKILNCILHNYSGGPVGIEALSATLSEDRNSIEDVYEPFLLKEGYLLRTPRGRLISDKAKMYLSTIEHKENF